jgi:hypothetical protein
MEVLKTIAIDIRESVFENDSEGILYITRDIYSDSYIVSIPIYTFSYQLREGFEEMDYKELYRQFPLSNTDQKEKLVQAIKEGIAEF